MSIFKKSFGKTVKDQIKLRESQVSSGDRTFFLQRQCTIRLASGVDIDLKGGNEYSHKSAINNVLQGGVLSPTYKKNKEDGTTSFEGFTTKKGFESTYDSPIDGYGRVPMPGITSVNIKTKTAYGSLREATVKFECHNLDQLSILERLYMRPGYPCLLEWGLSPYLSNIKIDDTHKINNTIPFISDDILFFTNPEQFIDKENKRDKDVQEAIQRLIREKKEAYSNNYDGIYGIVKNFNYSARQDGGFTCTTELIAIGEVLDSLIGVDGENNSSISFLEEFLSDLNEYSFAVSDVDAPGGQGGVQDGTDGTGDDYDTLVEGESMWRWNSNASFNRVGDFDPGDPIPKEDRSPYEEEGVLNKAIVNIDERTKRRNEIKEILKARGVVVSDDIKIASVNTYKDIKPLVYVTWRGIVKILNYYLNNLNLIRFTTLETPGDPSSELQFNHNKLEDNSKLLEKSNSDFPLDYSVDVTAEKLKSLDISTNPKVCWFPENFRTVSDYRTYVGNDIGEICFEVSYLYKTFRSQYFIKEDDNEKVNEDFTLGKYLKKIWDDVNDCCGGNHNFQIISHFQDPNLIKVIDQEFQSDIEKKDIHEFKVLGLKSIVREFNYDLTIPTSLTSTIAIAAQSAKSPQTLEEVTLRAFNKGLKNRFYHPSTTAGKVADKIIEDRRRAFDKVWKLKQYNDYKGSGDTGLYDITYNVEDPTIELIVGNNNKTAFQSYWEYIEALTELQIFIERLKGEIEEWEGVSNAAGKSVEALKEGYREAREAGAGVIEAASAADDAATDAIIDQFFIEEGEIVAETPILAQVNRYMRVIRDSDWGDDSESQLEKYGWKLAGAPYPDWDYIPDKDITTAKNYLRKVNNLKRELKFYNLTTYELLDEFNYDITTIIPLKLNMKLDGISGIVIGNVFNLDQSRLPKSYIDRGVSFIVTGESQEINGQDWVTTIVGQAVLL